MNPTSTAHPEAESPRSAHNSTTNRGGAGTILTVSTAWRTTYPQAHVGTLAMRDVANPRRHPVLQARKQAFVSRPGIDQSLGVGWCQMRRVSRLVRSLAVQLAAADERV